jgi:hypothetical protein
MLDFDPSLICRDELCEIIHVHAAHKVRTRKQKQVWKSRSSRPPWALPAPVALDDAIIRAVSDVHPRHFAAVVTEVENDFGSLGKNRLSGMRRVHRHLVQLCEAGRVLRVDVGGMLYGYLKPTSRIARDIGYIREQLRDAIRFQGDETHWREQARMAS